MMALVKMRLDYKIEPIVNGARVISITVTRKRGKKKIKWKFWDSGLPVSLAKLGEIIGEPKLVETDLNMPEGDPRWHKYVKQDCKVLRIAMEQFQATIFALGGQWKATLPGTAIDLFRRYTTKAIEDGEEVKIRRNRHFPECADVCKRCWQVKCFKSCPNKAARDEEIAHWKYDKSIQAHIGQCEWAPDGCAHFFFRRAFFGGRTEMFRQNFIDPYFDLTKKTYGDERGAGSPKGVLDRKVNASYWQTGVGLWIIPKDAKETKEKPLRDQWVRYRSPFRIFDINSSYPASMLSPMPTGRMWSYFGRKLFDQIWSKILDGTDRRAGFVECTVYVPKGLPYPPLPVRHDGKVKFPTGFLQGVWTAAELAAAVEMGVEIREVNRHVWIIQRAVFRKMISDLWSMRAEAKIQAELDKMGGHEGRAEVFKLCLNSFFGKFGSGEYKDEFLIADDEGLPENCHPYPGQENEFAHRPKHVDDDYINPQIAATITSNSRLALQRCFQQVEDKNRQAAALAGKTYIDITMLRGRSNISRLAIAPDTLDRDLIFIPIYFVWYTDTDSIHTNIDLPESDDLGGLKREYPKNDIIMCRYDTAKVYEIYLAGPCPKGCSLRTPNPTTKQYDLPCGHEIHEIVKSKGLQNPTSDKLAQLRDGESLPQRSIPQFRKLIRNGFKIFTTRYDDDENPPTKSMTFKYDKRKLDKITGETTPDHFEFDQVYPEKRAKFTPNQKILDSRAMSVKDKEAEWQGNLPKLAMP
jgi:hypothetical protein